MPEIPYILEPLSRRVADRALGAALLGQLATWDRLLVRPAGDSLTMELGFRVDYYTLLDGELGVPIPAGKGLSASWSQTLAGNDDCAVYANEKDDDDPRNGQPLYSRMSDEKGADAWYALEKDGSRTTLENGLADAPEPLMRQGRYFARALTRPVVLAALIAHHLAQADALGKFA